MHVTIIMVFSLWLLLRNETFVIKKISKLLEQLRFQSKIGKTFDREARWKKKTNKENDF